MSSADRLQVNCGALANALAERSSRKPVFSTISIIDCAMASTSKGSKYIPASPTTSGNDPRLLDNTGVAHAIASIAGSPNPSEYDGIATAIAEL